MSGKLWFTSEPVEDKAVLFVAVPDISAQPHPTNALLSRTRIKLSSDPSPTAVLEADFLRTWPLLTGLPGLPLKLVFPDFHLTLSDSVGKKTAFLRHLLQVLELPDVAVLTERAEQSGRDPETRESFDLVLARGVAKLPALLEHALPLCHIEGKVVAWKHGGIQRELESAQRALQLLGGRWGQIVPVALAGLTDNRILVTVEKVSATPAEYPRRPGLPRKQPL